MKFRLLMLVVLAACVALATSLEELRGEYAARDAGVVEYWLGYTQRNPADVWGWHYLGVAFAEAGAPAKAETAFLRTIRMEPDNSIHRVQLANLYSRIGRPRAALEQLVEAEAREANHGGLERIWKSREHLQRILSDIDRSKTRQVWTGGVLLLLFVSALVVSGRSNA